MDEEAEERDQIRDEADTEAHLQDQVQIQTISQNAPTKNDFSCVI